METSPKQLKEFLEGIAKHEDFGCMQIRTAFKDGRMVNFGTTFNTADGKPKNLIYDIEKGMWVTSWLDDDKTRWMLL